MELLPNKIIQQDTWTTLSSESIAPESITLEVPTIVPFGEKFIELFEQGPPHHNLGCLLASNQDVALLTPYIKHLPIIALVFPAFNDGRAFSQARALRFDSNFQGVLRATGNILPPQIGFMRRCGFDSIIIDTKRFSETIWLDAICPFPEVYQKQESHCTRNSTQDFDTPTSILRKRKTS